MAVWLDIKAAASRSGFSTKTIYRAISAGELKAAKVRSRWRIAVHDLEEWLRAGADAVAPPALLVNVETQPGSRAALRKIEGRRP
jgi:excisionase family DNA binding protein